MTQPFDLLLRGGEVIDLVAKRRFVADVAIRDGRIAAVAAGVRGNATRVLDARGLVTRPGWLDTHTHIFNLVKPSCLPADSVGVEQGVVAVLDAGSFGASNAAAFHEYVVKPARTLVFGLLHISRHGNMHEPGESEIVGWLNVDAAVNAIAEHRDWIVGLKVRASVSAVGALGMTPVLLAKKAATEAGVPLMAHVGNAPPTLDEVCRVFGERDVITHCFHGKAGGALLQGTRPLPDLVDAVARGVRLDVGHGSGSFSHRVAREAISQGLRPQHISTDLHRGNVGGPVYSLALTLSKLWDLGLDLYEVIAAASTAPAETFGIDAIRPVVEGAPANLTVFRTSDRELRVLDSYREAWTLHRVIEPRYAVVRGVVHEVAAGALSPGGPGDDA